jgi:hypothetical protein
MQRPNNKNWKALCVLYALSNTNFDFMFAQGLPIFPPLTAIVLPPCNYVPSPRHNKVPEELSVDDKLLKPTLDSNTRVSLSRTVSFTKFNSKLGSKNAKISVT